jgi:hypothetical protein
VHRDAIVPISRRIRLGSSQAQRTHLLTRRPKCNAFFETANDVKVMRAALRGEIAFTESQSHPDF